MDYCTSTLEVQRRGSIPVAQCNILDEKIGDEGRCDARDETPWLGRDNFSLPAPKEKNRESKTWLTGVSLLFVVATLAACGGGGGGDGSGATAAPSPNSATPTPPPDSGTPTPPSESNVSGFAYVTNFESNDVSAYTIDATTGTLSSIGTTATGSFPSRVAVTPSGKFAYATHGSTENIRSISTYTIDATTGALSEVAGSSFLAVGGAGVIAIHPTGKFAYSTGNENGGEDGDVFTYTLDAATGAVTRVGEGAFAGFGPTSVTVHPSGKFVYWVDYLASSVWGYTIDATTGALTRIDSDPLLVGGVSPSSITVDPSGRFAYVVNQGSADVSAYSIDATTGELTSIGAAVPTGTSPWSITVDPTGRFALVAGSGGVSTYTIDATTGVLSEVAGSPFAAGTSPRSVTVDPSGKFAYVANSESNDISAFTINATTGALTSIGAAVAAGTYPSSITTTRKMQ